MYETLVEGEPFLSKLVAGRARPSAIDDYISAWHEAPSGTRAAELELHDFLGMSWEEYARWAENPSTLRFIVAARKAGQPVEAIIEQTQVAGAAARSNDEGETGGALNWLERNEFIGPGEGSG